MRITILCVTLSTCLLNSAAIAETPSPKTPLDWAELLVKEITPDHNEYIHKNVSVKWKGEGGAENYECHADCSGFYTLLLERAYGWTPARIKKWLGTTRPLAHIWCDAIIDQKGFTRIKHIKEIKPGDVLATKFPPGEEDTGHIMLVAGEPRPRESTEPIEPGTQQWEILIIDSSKSGHGTDDTRHKADKTFNDGVGKGTLRLYSNRRGELVGYAWSIGKKSKFQGDAERPIVVGRLDPDFNP